MDGALVAAVTRRSCGVMYDSGSHHGRASCIYLMITSSSGEDDDSLGEDNSFSVLTLYVNNNNNNNNKHASAARFCDFSLDAFWKSVKRLI